MKGIKGDVAAIMIALLLIVVFSACMVNANGEKSQQVKVAENQSSHIKEQSKVVVSRGGYIRVITPKPKPITFSGIGIPEHDPYIDERITFYARERGIDPYLLAGMVWQESTFNPLAQGGNGFGLLQLEWACCQEMGVKYPCTDININLWAGSRYYKLQLDKFGDERVALAAYNCGPTFVSELVDTYGSSYESIKPHLPGTTRNHVFEVFEYREILKELNGQ